MKPHLTIAYPVATGIFLLSLAFYSCSLCADSAIDGVWQTGEDNSTVETFERDGEVFGKLVSSDNPKAKIGTEILRNFTETNGVWKGTLYAVKRDKLLNATIVPSANSLKINVSAGLMSQKLSWDRVQP